MHLTRNLKNALSPLAPMWTQLDNYLTFNELTKTRRDPLDPLGLIFWSSVSDGSIRFMIPYVYYVNVDMSLTITHFDH